MPRCIPEHPSFQSQAEEKVWRQLVEELDDRTTLMSNLRFEVKGQEHEIDFLVVRPGQGITLIEVKGGFISVNEHGQLFSHDAAGARHAINPADQCVRNHHGLAEYVGERWSRFGKPRLGWVVVFPDADLPQGFDAAALSRNRVVDRGLLMMLKETISKVAGSVEGGRISFDDAELFVDALTIHRDPILEWAHDAGRREEQVERWTEEQRRILSIAQAFESFAVQGPAGSGKTYLALEKTRRLAATGKRVALLCYTRGLATYLKSVTDSWPVKERPAFVGTFHSLADKWGIKTELRPHAWWERECTEEMLAKLRADRRGRIERYDATVVDEAQDFAEPWWDVVAEATKPGPNTLPLFVFGASDQQVFGRSGYEHLGLPALTLEENLRCTKPIAQFASLLTDKPPLAVGIDGPPVRFVQCASDSTTVDGIASDVTEALKFEGWEFEDIALLKTKSRHGVHKEFFPESDDPDEKDEQQRNYWKTFWEHDDLFYGTVGGFKGLERRVAVIGVDGFHSSEHPRDVMYVAATRARDLLVVVGDLGQIREAVGEKVAAVLAANPMSLPADDTGYDGETYDS